MSIRHQKILIFGNSGSGKSTLAKNLQAEFKLAHLDLDTLAWLPTDPPSRAPLKQSKQIIEQFMADNELWVIEGCYADLLSFAATQAEHAVFMNLPLELCQKNAMKRPWEPHKYESKAKQDANLPMLLDWMAAYTERHDEFSYQAHTSLYNQFEGSKKEITQNQNM